MILPQSYPLWIAIVDKDVADPNSLLTDQEKTARLVASTLRVVGWRVDSLPDADPELTPMVTPDGVPSYQPYPMGDWAMGFIHFYSESRLRAIQRALRFCCEGLTPSQLAALILPIQEDLR